jgi:subtilisin family serine protease
LNDALYWLRDSILQKKALEQNRSKNRTERMSFLASLPLRPTQESAGLCLVSTILISSIIPSANGALSLSPSSINEALDSGQTKEVVLTLENTGAAPLEWTADAVQDAVAGSGLGASAAGTDSFGYRWADSAEPDGPVFEWVDISAYGDALFLGDDDFSEVALPFPFVFYGEEYASVKVTSNGYLTFGADGTDHTNDPIPSTADPNALVAAYWTDLDPTLGGSVVTYHDTVNARFLVQYTDVQPFGGGDPVSFQVVLHETGDITFHYKTDTGIGALAGEVTVGIEDAAGATGSSVAYSGSYVYNGLAVRFASPTWLSVSPRAGTLAAGATTQVTVRLNAGALVEDVYTGTVPVTEAGSAPVEVPVSLTVTGTPAIEVEPPGLVFAATGIGGSDNRSVSISNPGTAPLTVSAIDFSNTDFSVAQATPFDISPGAALQLVVTHAPTTTGEVNATANILSNDSANPSIEVSLSGEGLPPSDIGVSPAILSLTLPAGDSAQTTLGISNSGIAPLNWNAVLDGDVPGQTAQEGSSAIVEPDFSRAYGTDRILVKMKDEKDVPAQLRANLKSRRASLADESGATKRRAFGRLRNLEVWELKKEAKGKAAKAVKAYKDQPEKRVKALVKWLREQPEVLYAEPDYRIQLDPVESELSGEIAGSEGPGKFPVDPGFGLLWGLNNTGQEGGTPDADIDAPEAWLLQTGAPEVVVAVIDTGVDYDHEDLADNMWVNLGEIPENGLDDDGNGYVDDIHGWDWVNNDRDPDDDHDHGSHCAGTIAGVGDNGIGVSGVAWNTQIMALKFLDGNGSGYLSDAIYAIDYAAANGARITSNSWGGGGYSQAMADSIEAAGEAGVLFVAAAGNSSSNNDTSPTYPCSYELPIIVSVAATTRFDERAYFSNYGATSVDLAAPGAEIFSTKKQGTYGYFSGTSMATPHVTGAAAMILGKNPLLTPAQVKAILLDSVDPIPALDGRTLTGGRLNLRRALDQAAPPWFSLDPTSGVVAPGTTENVTLSIDASFLPEGLIEGTITLFSDDPDEPVVEVPLQVTVTPAPALLAEPAALDFGDILLGGSASLDLGLANSGSQTLTVSAASVTGPFSHDGSFPLSIEPGERVLLAVEAAGQAVGPASGTLSLSSDDPTDPVVEVPLGFTCLEPPVVSTIPARIDLALVSGQTATEVIDLGNSGVNGLEFAFTGELPGWLSIGAASGTVPPGDSVAVELQVDTAGLAAAQYATELVLETNDPLNPVQSLLIVLQVSDGPVLVADPAAVEFGGVYLGYLQDRTVTLRNDGNQTLNVSATSVSGAGLSLPAPWSGSLAPGASTVLTVRADPTAAGPLDGALTVSSDDPVNPALAVPLAGSAREAPGLLASPSSFSFALNEGETDGDTLLIQNNGLETLEVSLEVVPDGGGASFGEILSTIDLDEATGDETIFAAEYADDRFYIGGANRGPNIPQIYVLDKEGNYIRRFDLPGVTPGYNGAYDLAWDGTALWAGWTGGIVKFDTAGNFISSLPLPEEFEVIAGIACDPDSGNLWINGYSGDVLEIDQTGTILRRFTPPPVEGLYGMAWDEASPDGPFLWIYEIKELSTRKIHQFDPVAGEFTGFTFTVNPAIGWAAGLGFTTEWEEGQATLLAVTQAEEDRWVHVVNVADVQGWLSLDTYAAAVPPGGSASIGVLVDSTGILGGAHSAQINLTSNDPASPALSFPVSLDVTGTPAIEVPGASIAFEEPVFIGGQAGQGFLVRNSGTDVLTVSALTVSGASFSLADDSPFTLDPQQTRELEVVFAPAATGAAAGTLTLVSDAPGQSPLEVALSGQGMPAPVVDVDTTPVALNLYAGEQTSFDLSIGNTGGSTLVWQASPHDVAVLSSVEVAGSGALPFIVPGDEPDHAGKLGGGIGIAAELLESTPKTAPYADGFEDGRFTDDWYLPYTTSKTEVSNASAGEGSYSFHAYASTESAHQEGIYQRFETCLPDYFSFRVRTDDLGQANAYVVLGEETWQLQGVVYFFNTQTGLWFMGDNYDSIQTPAEAERWYLVECRDIDWTARTFDYYIDGTLVQRDLGFRSPDATAVNRLDIYNYRAESGAWWDDIRLSVDTAEWMRLQTAAAETEAAGSTQTNVSVSAGYLDAGSYNGYIIVRSNDPATPDTSVPVTLNVTSAPGIHLPQTAVDFGGVVQGGSTSAGLILSNSGTEALTVSALNFSDPAFSSGQTLPLTLQPGEQTVLPVGFSPSSTTAYAGTLTLVSNCPVPHPAITLAGEGLQPPAISADTTPISLSVPAGQSATGSLVIDNLGAGDLEVEAFLFTEAVSGGGAAPAGTGALKAGGPDNFGYTFRDERDADGPMYQWEEIAIPEGGGGTEITGLTGFTASSDSTQNDDAYVWPFDLPFDFPFYGIDYTQIAVGAYGVTYFEDDGFGWYTKALPTDNVATGRGTNTFIATYNDNLDILPGAIYIDSSPERTIIQHYQVTSLFSEWATFQTILYPNGDIRMQWYETGPWLKGSSATIGIQGDTSNALQYGRWSNLVEDGRCIYYTHPGNPFRDWLRSDTRTATVPGGGSHTLDYTVQGEFLLPGTYHGSVELRSNDAGQPVVTIPVTLTVTDPSTGGLALIRNFTALVPEGGAVVLNDGNLLAASPVAEDEAIVYSVTSTGDGQCLVNGSPASSFTQADIAAGLVAYEHDGSDTSASTSLGFTISDGVDTIGPIGLTLNVGAVNDPPVLSGPAGFGAVDGIYVDLEGMDLEDPDISPPEAAWALSLQVDHGKVRFQYVPGGVNFAGGDAVQNNDSANVSVQTWLSRLQANLRTPGGIQYQPDPGYTGPDTLTVIVNDNGNTGTGPGYMEALYVPIEVYATDIERWRHAHFNEADLGDPLLEPTLWGDEANPDFDLYNNLFEYLMLGDPLTADLPLTDSGHDGVHLWMSFPIRSQHPGVDWHGEWSSSLSGPWSTAGILTDTIEENNDHDLIRIRIPAIDPDPRFLRLEAVVSPVDLNRLENP